MDNLESNLETVSVSNPFLIILISDFNAKCTCWYSKDNSTTGGSKLRLFTSQFGLNQIINEPTHITKNSSTCIDLLFTSQTNLVIESGVHSSLYPNCHHQIIFAKFDLRIFYPPPYERNVWHYKQANIELFRRAIDNFDWNRALDNVSPNRQVSIFNDTILNIISNFIPHETIICDDRDPPWINSKIKKVIHEKNKEHKKYINNKSNFLLLQNINNLQAHIKTLIDVSKQKYFSRISQKLESTSINTKCYWSLLKTFLNNKKIPCIPPLYHDDKFVCDFKEKSKIFNNYFAQQCSVINKNSTVPERILYRIDVSLAKIVFTTDDIANIIKNLDSNKSHGHDNISIRMSKICGVSVCKPLEIIFRTCLNHGKFPEEWKKFTVVLVFKTGDKQCNYVLKISLRILVTNL